ncbi:cGMP-dependent protein kinase 2 [Merluccius polli]|uniref:cGMP-dependent protein kinase n=1 Tax=Merluccius polli TaxID=89951 RepID=A0AA47N6G0_MERPO|nr:cGMP-dependent protein kinase 2 [Merluccius polli]
MSPRGDKHHKPARLGDQITAAEEQQHQVVQPNRWVRSLDHWTPLDSPGPLDHIPGDLIRDHRQHPRGPSGLCVCVCAVLLTVHVSQEPLNDSSTGTPLSLLGPGLNLHEGAASVRLRTAGAGPYGGRPTPWPDMGNGSIKAPQAAQRHHSCLCNRDPAGWDVEPLRLRITHLEEKLAQREKDFQVQELQLRLLRQELDAKCSQVEKLQDALAGYSHANGHPLGALPPPPLPLASAIDQGSASRFHRAAVEVHRRLKAKEGVSAEPTSGAYCGAGGPGERAVVRKDSQTKRLINAAMVKNDFLKKLEPQHQREMVDCMYPRKYTQGQLVIQEGEPGNYLYVLADGLLQVIQNGKLLGEMRPGTAFGELAILYNCKRTASVKAVSRALIWALDRQTFQSIMMRSTQARHQEYFNFLRSVSLLKELPEEKLAKIVDCLEVDYFNRGEFIIREGEEGNTFFIIAKGEVTVTQTTEAHGPPQEIKTLGVGDYFGEKALISEDVRSANIVCNANDTQCLVVDRENFNQMVGTYDELQAYLKEYVEELSRSDEKRNALPQSPQADSPTVQEWRRLQDRVALLPHHRPFHKLKVIATLGMGGFGRVELVKLEDEDTTFALKCIKKKHIVDTRQQEHIYSEKNILQLTNSPFIVRLFRTFRDDRCVYLLLEACLGGELWSVLRDMNFFDDSIGRFCIGCVLEAFDYLHVRGIVYRDLKPENLLLDADGYVKMADFGFAKKIGLGKKTWTFCGTPEYVAPEVVMNKGHDFGADCWSLGILIFELLTGNPPFSGSDHIKIYTMVLHGIEKVDFPKRIGKRPDDLIRRLCRRANTRKPASREALALNPVERLGNKKNGILDIKKHKWFQGFNWDGLRHRRLQSPLKREVRGPLDHSHFDVFPPDLEEPPEELSGWDRNF